MWESEQHPENQLEFLRTRMYGSHTLPELLVFYSPEHYKTILDDTQSDTPRYATLRAVFEDVKRFYSNELWFSDKVFRLMLEENELT